MTVKTLASAPFTCGFKGFENDSLWFPPFLNWGDHPDAEAMQAASLAKARAGALIEVGCSMAAAEHPELSDQLRALSKAELDLDFFEFGPQAPAMGWFRLSASAPGASAEALRACEDALTASRSPLMAAAASGALLAFGSGATDEVPTSFLASALNGTSKMAAAFSAVDQPLAAADFFELASADGSKRLLACAPSCALAGDPLADMKTFAKLAQASVEASRSVPQTPAAEAFFSAMQAAMMGSAGSALPQRIPLEAPKGTFAARPAQARAMMLGGLPAEGFDDCARAFATAVAKRFGPIAARSLGSREASLFESPTAARSLSHAEWASLSPLLAKLPLARAVSEAHLSAAASRSAPPKA